MAALISHNAIQRHEYTQLGAQTSHSDANDAT